MTDGRYGYYIFRAKHLEALIIVKEYDYTSYCSSRKRYEYAIIKINQ